MADAVVIPGRMFGPGAPLPMYTGDLAESRGATVHRHEWTSTPPPAVDPWVRAQITPLLKHPPVASALSRATAPFLLVGGSADPLWDGELGRRLTPHVFEVPGADHGMYVPGPVTASIAVLAQVIDAVTEFLDEIGWPRR